MMRAPFVTPELLLMEDAVKRHTFTETPTRTASWWRALLRRLHPVTSTPRSHPR